MGGKAGAVAWAQPRGTVNDQANMEQAWGTLNGQASMLDMSPEKHGRFLRAL